MIGTTQGIASITVKELQHIMDTYREDEYLLVDVRQPEEYASEHIPGAKLIPLMEIEAGKAELQPAEHTIFYCRTSNRSRRGAQAMVRSGGFKHVYILDGGLSAWQGRTLPDFPSVHVFDGTETLPELLQRALDLEKGAERLYRAMLEQFNGSPEAGLIQSLEEAEEGHARALYSMLKKVTDEPLAPFEEYYGRLEGLLLESGEPLVKMVAWLTNNSADRTSVLEVALDMELKAYDLYRNLAEKAEDAQLKEAFLDLAVQERRHARIVLRGIGNLATA
jgi:rubrerythrin/rhodanese-related sulfurtransferase